MPVFARGGPRAAALIALFGVFAAINVKGARDGGRTVAVLTVLKLLPLAALVVWGVSAVRPEHYAWTGMPDAISFGRTALLLLFALTGFESAVLAGGELTNPARTLPVGVTIGVALSAAHLHGDPPGGAASSARTSHTSRPRRSPRSPTGSSGPGGRTLILAAAAISMLGFMSGDLLSNPRIVYALAANGMMPRVFAGIHPRYGTRRWPSSHTPSWRACWPSLEASRASQSSPRSPRSSWIFGVVLASVPASPSRSVSRPTSRLSACLAGCSIPTIATLLIVALLLAATRDELIAVGGFIALVSVSYFARRRLRSQDAGSSAAAWGA